MLRIQQNQKGGDYQFYMLIRHKKMNPHIIKILIFIIFISTFISYSCKGKESKQEFLEPTSAKEQQGSQEETLPKTSEHAISEESSNIQEINTPPKITTINVIPNTPIVGDQIKVEVQTYDREGDEVTLDYQWFKDNTLLSEGSNVLTVSKNFRRGDKIILKVTPFDGKTKGFPLEMVITISNAIPQIIDSSETFRFDGGRYSYQIKATDPDGDSLTYSLKSAPEGMKINPTTGLIQWNIPHNFKGKTPVTVSVSDNQGGEVLQSFTIEIP